MNVFSYCLCKFILMISMCDLMYGSMAVGNCSFVIIIIIRIETKTIRDFNNNFKRFYVEIRMLGELAKKC